MVADQLRTVFHRIDGPVPRRRAVLAGGALHQIRIVFEVYVVDSKYPDEGQSASDDGDSGARLPFRTGGSEHHAPVEARPELRDRETYYTELRFAVHCQSRSIPQPRAALEDQETETWKRRPDDESWDDMTARFGDTWT
jgi:hypothetical protein